MGQCGFKEDERGEPGATMSKMNFEFKEPIGQGGFGKVWSVEYRKTKQIFAMKEMLKARILLKRSVKSVMSEKKLLERLQHPFLCNMHYAF